MNAQTADKLYAMLLRLYEAHEELLGVLREQQQAIRRCDAGRLEALRDRCDLLGQRILELDAARQQLTGAGVKVSELAAGAPEPQQSRLVALSAGLRKLAEQIASMHRVNQAAVRNMLNHFHAVYRMLASAGKSGGYGSAGAANSGGQAFMIDAVA